MAFSWWADAGMTVPLSRLDFSRTNVPAPVDAVAWFGNPVPGTKLQAAADPGAAALLVTVSDDAPASGVEADQIKLANSVAALDAASWGAPVNLAVTINAGTAVPVYVRIDSPLVAGGNYDGIELQVPDWVELEV